MITGLKEFGSSKPTVELHEIFGAQLFAVVTATLSPENMVISSVMISSIG